MRKHTLAVALLGLLAIIATALSGAAPATAKPGGHAHPPICHPVGSATGGNQHDGYSLISPDQASSHIDESLYPDGHYWKHEHGARHDKYATLVDGSYSCDDLPPATPTPDPTPPCTTGPCHMPTKATDAPDVTICRGIITNTVLNDVVVKPDGDCTLVNVYINGDLRTDRAHNVTLGDTNVKGSIYATHVTGTFTDGATNTVCAADPLVGGSLFATHSHNVVLCNLSVCRAVNLDANDGRVMVRQVIASVIRVQNHTRFVRDPGAHHHALSTLRLRDDTAHRFVIRHNKRPVLRVGLTVT